jgi:hypothetical protein
MIELIPARLWHCGQMARALRQEHRAAVLGLGLDPHAKLRMAYDETVAPKALLIDGELAAIGGVAGAPLAPCGHIWLALSQRATSHPLAIVREAKAQIASAMTLKRELATTIVLDDETSIRCAAVLGFKFCGSALIPWGTGFLARMHYRPRLAEAA